MSYYTQLSFFQRKAAQPYRKKFALVSKLLEALSDAELLTKLSEPINELDELDSLFDAIFEHLGLDA